MRRIFIKVAFCLTIAALCTAQTKPLYQLPETLPSTKASDRSTDMIVGTDEGLFRISQTGSSTCLWNGGKVMQIVRTSSKWYLLTSAGIIATGDLKTFTPCNEGITFLTVKEYADGQKTLVQQSPLLKDLCVDPLDENILVTATKDAVYLTRDGGTTWKNIGSASVNTGGMKAVAVNHMPSYASDGSVTGSEVVVFMSHPIYGFSYYRADVTKKWVDVSAGLVAMPSLTQPDEIADIVPVLSRNADGSVYSEIYLSQTYLPRIYRFNWKTKRAECIYQSEEQLTTIDSLCQSNANLIFATLGEIKSFSLTDGSISSLPQKEYAKWSSRLFSVGTTVNAAYVPPKVCGLDTPVSLNELWLLTPETINSPYGQTATGRKAVYISAYQVRNDDGIKKYRKIVSDNKLNAVVVDMKDDYGYLRFEPETELLKQKGRVTSYKIDVDRFVSQFKEDGVYLIARIVVFKDKCLSQYGNSKYAVWNRATNSPWVGLKGTEDVTADDGTVTKQNVYYDENWVDPYCEEVWEYNVAVAQELIARGFDEIQFDYIRFPTDGLNLSSATYRWRDTGMDKESALVSFLSYARKNINAPIGIDIYGANGWYRSGTRTGQDVELMSDYVDVICPMFYPSHFEQDFLEYAPVEERPYRIYFYGTYRNTVMGRNKIVVRPWVQAFYLGVRYDRTYYDKNYVKREIFGVRDSVDRGYMYWNNSGGYYDDISPDPADNEESPWKKNEADLQNRLPAFSSGSEGLVSSVNLEEINKWNQDMISILDTVMWPEEETSTKVHGSLLRVGSVR